MPINALKSIVGLTVPRYGVQTEFIVYSSLGISHTIVRWITQALSIAGFFIVLKKCDSEKPFLFTIMSGTMLFLLLLWAILPYASYTFDLARAFAIGLLGFSVFVASAIIESRKILKKWFPVFTILIIVAIFIDSAGEPILYLPKSSQSPQLSHVYKQSDLSFADWLERFTKKDSVFFSDEIGYLIGGGFAQRNIVLLDVQNSTDMIRMLEIRNFNYFLSMESEGFLSFYRSQFNIFILNTSETYRLYNNSRLIRTYDNGRILLIHKQ
jgi:hypothetical protein